MSAPSEIQVIEFEQAPEIGVRWNSDCITGVLRSERGFVVIVDVASIFSIEDTQLLSPIGKAA